MTVSRPFRSSSLLLLAGALACSSGGGSGPAAAPTPVPTAEAPPVTLELAAPPSFAATAAGNGWVDGTATAAASTRYFREVSGVRGQPFELKGDATGDEKDKACGTDWRASAARSLVVVTPEAGAGTTGFTLSALAAARRGTWRTKATLSCTTVNYTDAQAATMARGQAWITLGGDAGGRDQLVIETSGSTTGEWALSVTDTTGAKYATTPIGSTLVAEVPGSGRYSVAASVTARAAAGATTRDSVEVRLRATVKVSSLRHALAGALGAAPLKGLEAPFTVSVPAAALAAPMREALAGYQPCGAKPGCGGKVSDLAVTAVEVRPAGGGAEVDLTMSGKKRSPIVVRLVGPVRVGGDSLRAADLRLAAGQPDIAKKKDLAAAVALFGERASAAAVPVGPERATAESAVRARFPVRVGDLCLPASAEPGAFLGAAPAEDGAGFVAWFGLAPSSLQPCGRSR